MNDDSSVNFGTLKNHQKWKKIGNKNGKKSIFQKLTYDSSAKDASESLKQMYKYVGILGLTL